MSLSNCTNAFGELPDSPDIDDLLILKPCTLAVLDVCTNAAPVSKFVLAEVGNVSVASLKSNVPVNIVFLAIV